MMVWRDFALKVLHTARGNASCAQLGMLSYWRELGMERSKGGGRRGTPTEAGAFPAVPVPPGATGVEPGVGWPVVGALVGKVALVDEEAMVQQG